MEAFDARWFWSLIFVIALAAFLIPLAIRSERRGDEFKDY